MKRAVKKRPSLDASRHSKLTLSELEKNGSGVVRDIQAGLVQYVVDDGKIVAIILPLQDEADSDRERDVAWDALEDLGRQIDRARETSKSSVQILSEMRR